MNVLIHIPARAGSRRLPGKNLRTVGGKALVSRAAEVAADFAYADPDTNVIVDTDSQEIATAALDHGAHAWLPRPEDVAGDRVTSAETIISALDRLGMSENPVVILLQPTSPLRTKDDVQACWNVFRTGTAQSVVSVTRGTSVPNGAVYIIYGSVLRRRHSFFLPGESLLVPMPEWRSIDINTEADLERAEAILRGE